MKRSGSYIEFKSPLNEDLDYMDIRPQKVDCPAVGSYEVERSDPLVKKIVPKWSFSKSKQLKFTEEMANNKKDFPGAGKYQTDKCFNVISRPYMRKR